MNRHPYGEVRRAAAMWAIATWYGAPAKEEPMQSVTQALLSEIVDYAGLFPPASLPFEPAFRNYLDYRRQDSRWMLARFICPAASFDKLAGFERELHEAPDSARLSVLPRSAESASVLSDLLFADAQACRQVETRSGGKLRVDGVELRMPLQSGESPPDGGVGLVRRIQRILAESGLGHVPVFLEPALTGDWRETVIGLTRAIAETNSSTPGPASAAGSGAASRFGLKLRTGGTEPSAFPRSEQVAFVIEQCRDQRVPMKFTAGLHHPLRRFDPGVRAQMHGFLNIFGAAILAFAVALDLHDIRAVVEESDVRHFHFADPFFGWNDAEATLDEVRFIRANYVTSFGSCSFTEPLEDLAAMKLIP